MRGITAVADDEGGKEDRKGDEETLRVDRVELQELEEHINEAVEITIALKLHGHPLVRAFYNRIEGRIDKELLGDIQKALDYVDGLLLKYGEYRPKGS